ncbi:MAG: hypothetical protein NTV61_06190 [Candidatus Bathyarchaeota archaeon]|nr:hypothetical protein [Candidatus Bathyarchaeota archaeon]
METVQATVTQLAPVDSWKPHPDEGFEEWVERLAKHREEKQNRDGEAVQG